MLSEAFHHGLHLAQEPGLFLARFAVRRERCHDIADLLLKTAEDLLGFLQTLGQSSQLRSKSLSLSVIAGGLHLPDHLRLFIARLTLCYQRSLNGVELLLESAKSPLGLGQTFVQAHHRG